MSYHFITSAKLPTRHGEFDIHMFENGDGQEHVMLTVGLPVDEQDTLRSAISTISSNQVAAITATNRSAENTNNKSTDKVLPSVNAASNNGGQQLDEHHKTVPLVRIHSECLTGDAFSSLKCDCGAQLNTAMQAIQAEGCGAILYLRQEGRGIGLTNKIRAYALQDQGHDTLDANLMLGFPADARTYDMCGAMLAHVAVDKVRLITNNPDKIAYLTEHDIEVVERVPLVVGVNAMNADYLATKRDRMGHLLDPEI